MLKEVALILIGFCFVACTSTPVNPSEKTDVSPQKGNVSGKKESTLLKTYVAIMDFSILSEDKSLSGLSREIPQSLTAVFLKNGIILPVERQELNKALDELQLAVSDMGDEKQALKLGKILGAKYILMGSLTKLGNQVKINCRLIGTETSEILFTDSVRGAYDDLFNLEDQLASKIENYLLPEGGK